MKKILLAVLIALAVAIGVKVGYKTLNPPTEVSTLKIEGMTCQGCEVNLRKKIEAIPGVKSAQLDHKTGDAVIEHESKTVSTDQLKDAINQTDYKVVEDKLEILNYNLNY